MSSSSSSSSSAAASESCACYPYLCFPCALSEELSFLEEAKKGPTTRQELKEDGGGERKGRAVRGGAVSPPAWGPEEKWDMSAIVDNVEIDVEEAEEDGGREREKKVDW